MIPQHLEMADSSGLQALHHASSKGQERLVTALLEKGVDPDARGKLNQTPLMLGQCKLLSMSQRLGGRETPLIVSSGLDQYKLYSSFVVNAQSDPIKHL